MNIKLPLGIVLLSILIANVWNDAIIEGIYNPAPVLSSSDADIKRTLKKKVVRTICEGGFVLPGFPSTVI